MSSVTPEPNVSVTLEFSPDEVAALQRSGFLADGRSSPRDIEIAVFETLYAAWRHGLSAASPRVNAADRAVLAASSPADNAEAEGEVRQSRVP